MKLSSKTLERLKNIITGDSKISPYRSGPKLIDFFYDFGERDLYGQGFPARHAYTLDKLKLFNGSEKMKGIVEVALEFFDEEGFNAEEVAEGFNTLLNRDGYRIVIEYGTGWMQGNEHIRGAPYFEIRTLTPSVVVPTQLIAISHEAVNEQVSKANERMEKGDFSGAIASTYTLVEELLKALLRETNTSFKDNEGNIKTLYSAVREPLNLNPKGEQLENHLKTILDGLQKQIAGLYEVANKASDRHARKYNPAPHHAKLAINSAFALCEFLVDSHAYQRQRSKKNEQL